MIVSVIKNGEIILSEYFDELSEAVRRAERLERAIIANGFHNLSVSVNKIN